MPWPSCRRPSGRRGRSCGPTWTLARGRQRPGDEVVRGQPAPRDGTSGRREESLVDESLPIGDAVLEVDFQHRDGYAADGGAADQDRAVPAEVPAPLVPAGGEKRRELASVEPCNAGALVVIAGVAGQAQIAGPRGPPCFWAMIWSIWKGSRSCSCATWQYWQRRQARCQTRASRARSMRGQCRLPFPSVPRCFRERRALDWRMFSRCPIRS